MQLTAHEIALIAGGFAIIGTLLGAWITYRFSLNLSVINARREARHRLIDAFTPELAALDPVNNLTRDQIKITIEDALPRHQRAMVEFGFYLPKETKEDYEKTCKEYYEVVGSVRLYDYFQKPDGRDTFRKRVHAILKFTER